jgi:hypothetical protein
LSEDLTPKIKKIEGRVRVKAGSNRRKMRGDQKICGRISFGKQKHS